MGELSEDEKVSIRRHLQYPNVTEYAQVQSAFSFQIIAYISQLEVNMERLRPAAAPGVRLILQRLDQTHQQMDDARELLGITGLGSIGIAPDAMKKLEMAYRELQARLANEFQVTVNPSSAHGSLGSITVPVLR